MIDFIRDAANWFGWWVVVPVFSIILVIEAVWIFWVVIDLFRVRR